QIFVRGPELQRYQEELARWEEAQRRKAEEEAARADGAAVDSAGVAAAGTNGGAPVAERHPHIPAIPFETPEHALTLTTAGAAVEARTFKNILDTTYVIDTSAVKDYDPERGRQPFQILRPFGVPGVRSFAVEPVDPVLAEAARGDWKHEPLPGG